MLSEVEEQSPIECFGAFGYELLGVLYEGYANSCVARLCAACKHGLLRNSDLLPSLCRSSLDYLFEPSCHAVMVYFGV